MVLVLSVVLLVLFTYYKYSQIKNYWAKKGVTHARPLPIIGNLRVSKSEDFVKNIYNAYPTKRYVGLHHFHQPTLLIRDPKLIKTILVKEFNSFSEHSTFNRGIGERHKNVFFMKVTEGWNEMRQFLSPAFTATKLRLMFRLVEQCGDAFVKHFKKEHAVEVCLKDAFSRYVNDTTYSTVIGVDCDSFTNKNNILYSTGKKLTDFSGIKGIKMLSYNISPLLVRLLNVKMVSRDVGELFGKLLADVLKVRKERGIERHDVLNFLTETKNKNSSDFTDDDIVSAAISFYFASFDNTSTVATFVSYALATYPHVQKKLQVEVDETVARCNGQLTYDEIMKIEYLEMVIKESLRKWCIPIIDRLCIKPFTIEPVNHDEKPVTIDPGTSVWFSVKGMCHDPKYFENPDDFEPERFNRKNKSYHPYSYFPFGLGPRTCLGNRYGMLMLHLIFVKIVSNFELVPCKKTPVSVNLGFGMYVPPKGDLIIQFKPRRS